MPAHAKTQSTRLMCSEQGVKEGVQYGEALCLTAYQGSMLTMLWGWCSFSSWCVQLTRLHSTVAGVLLAGFVLVVMLQSGENDCCPTCSPQHGLVAWVIVALWCWLCRPLV